MIFKVFQSALHNTRRWEDEIIDKRSKKSQIYIKKMCIKLYFFKEIWSSSCIDGHDLYIISNLCLHRNCHVDRGTIFMTSPLIGSISLVIKKCVLSEVRKSILRIQMISQRQNYFKIFVFKQRCHFYGDTHLK
jgi:hypothetical protein